jgi:hypothetical protein
VTPSRSILTQPRDDRIDRRQALRRIAGAGAVAWSVPAVQTLNMSRALAQAQTSIPTTCSWFRISANGRTPIENDGICTGVDDHDSCLSTTGSNTDCSPVVGIPLTPSRSGWTVPLGPGYEIIEVALSAEPACWRSTQDPNDHSRGMPAQDAQGAGSWPGWSVFQGYLQIPQPDGGFDPIAIHHVDVIACLPPSVLAPSGPSGPSGESGATGPSDAPDESSDAPSGPSKLSGPTGPEPTGPSGPSGA